jgi:hypothetical protein
MFEGEEMNYREEITKLIRASYDQGAKDAQQEALAALEQMVAAARADEREACAKVCEETEVVQTTYCMTLHDEGAKTLCNAAAAIRARGNT